MTDIKFGFHYGRIHEEHPPHIFAPTVESMGFDSVWLAEGLVNELPMLDIMMAMSTFVHHTRRLTVGGGVVLLPLRHPAILAKEVSTLDRLSGGRIILGIGVGGPPHSNPASFEVTGVKLSERGARTDECLEIMTKLWGGEPVSHHGRFYHFNDISMTPPPLQHPHPPLWAGGMSSQMLRRTARWCDGFFPVDVSPSEYLDALGRIKGYADGFGRSVDGLTKAIHLFFRLGRTKRGNQGKRAADFEPAAGIRCRAAGRRSVRVRDGVRLSANDRVVHRNWGVSLRVQSADCTQPYRRSTGKVGDRGYSAL